MTAKEFIERMNRIREKDSHDEVYSMLMDLPVSRVLEIFHEVDQELFEQELKELITSIELKLKAAVK